MLLLDTKGQLWITKEGAANALFSFLLKIFCVLEIEDLAGEAI